MRRPGGATGDELRAEVKRQQGGQKTKRATLTTSTARSHRHTAKVDFFGDGQTDVDASGHVHRVSLFVLSRAQGHSHDFIQPT